MKRVITALILLAFSEHATSQIVWSNVLSKSEIILIGEQAHGVHSFYQEKKNIIKQIEKESSKDLLLLIESPLVLSVVRALQNAKSNYHYHHTNTEENIEFFSNYENLGMDLQEDCRYKEFSEYLKDKKYCDRLDKDMLMMDSILSLCILGDNYVKDRLSGEEVNKLKSSIQKLELKVLSKISDEKELKLIQICFKNRVRLADYFGIETKKRYQHRIRYRDSIMAVNVKELVHDKENCQVIIWASNLHVGSAGVMGKRWARQGVKSMSEHLETDYTLYRIAIDSKRGKTNPKHFQDVVITQKRELVDPKYLEINCE